MYDATHAPSRPIPGDVQRLIDAMPEACVALAVALTSDGRLEEARVAGANARARSVAVTAADPVGREVHEVWSAPDDSWRDEVAAVARTGKPRTYEHVHGRRMLRCLAFRPPGDRDLVCVNISDATDQLRIREALETVASLSSPREPGGVYRALTDYLVRALNVSVVGISRLIDDGSAVETLTLWVDGAYHPTARYSLHASPCGAVVRDGFRCLLTGVRQAYPEYALLREMHAEGYMGVALRDCRGATIGLVSCVFRDPVSDAATLEAIVRIAAIRAAAELEHDAAMAAVQAGEAHYRILADNVLDVIWMLGPDGRFAYVSPSVQKLRGFTPDEVMEHPLDVALTPGSLAIVQAAVASGMEALQRGEPLPEFRGELEQPCKDGSTVWTEASVTGLYGADGSLTGFLGISRDITERRRAEAERLELERRLMEARRLESVGRLAGGVAHDLNNQLAVIMGLTEVVSGDLPADAQAHEMLSEILQVCRRAGATVAKLLAYAAKSMIQPRRLDLTDAVAQHISALQASLGEGMQLVWSPHSEPLPVYLDASQVRYVVDQLCANARDACDGTGCVRLSTAAIDRQAEAPALSGGRSADRYAALVVADNGRGMTEAQIANAFEPFHTSKAFGAGHGMGLPAVHGIATQNSGLVEVTSRPGEGAVVRVLFPISREAPGA